MAKTNKSGGKALDVAGVVEAGGPGGGISGREKLWTLSFVLQPWRILGGEIDESELIVLEKVSERTLAKRMKDIRPYNVLRLRVRPGSKQHEDGRRRVTLVRILGKGGDKELARWAKDLQRPAFVHDKFFGKLKLDRAANWYETKATWLGKKVALQFWRDDNANDDPALFRLAERLWKAQKKWDQRIRTYAEQELLTLKIQNWLDEGKQPVSPAEFKKRTKLVSVAVSSDGSFEFAFDDGDLFWGHLIVVSGTLAAGPDKADIVG